MKRVLLMAAHNQGKRREYESMLSDVLPQGWTFQDLGSWGEEIPDVVEDRDTFVGNAIKKAVESTQAAGVPALSEDSGLAVDALDGAPGVYSARFSGVHGDNDANNALLLERMADVPDGARTARYIALTCLAVEPDDAGHELLAELGLAWEEVPDGEPEEEGVAGRTQGCVVIWWRGTVEGEIARDPRGTGGFGYDPLFHVKPQNRRMAELTPAEKNAISHRGDALRKLKASFDR